MGEVEYFEIPGAPGKYFACSAYRASLATHRCAAMYCEAKGAQLGTAHALEKCIGCAIGANHAGDKVVEQKERIVGRLTCARCHSQAPRLVKGGICVSCANRAAEVAKGKNAKGVAPHPVERFWGEPEGARGKGKTVVLHRVSVAMVRDGRVRIVTADKAADTLEVMLTSMRDIREPVAFCRATPVVLKPVTPKFRHVQLTFLGGL